MCLKIANKCIYFNLWICSAYVTYVKRTKFKLQYTIVVAQLHTGFAISDECVQRYIGLHIGILSALQYYCNQAPGIERG